jgi:Zn-finger nucleic acid-binding protein
MSAAFTDNLVVANCESCGAPTRVDRALGVIVCEHCGSQRELPAFLKDLELQSESSSVCPVCSVRLSEGRLKGHPLLCCARCFGMLIDMNRFTTVIDAVRMDQESYRTVLPRQQNPGDRLVHCPTCGQPMFGHLYGGPGNIVIDTCERCQVNWLDSGELRRIAVAPDRFRE